MPFTPTHALAVTPFAWAWPRALPLSALVIGSMIPDAPLFIPIGLDYGSTHSWLGVLALCLPVGVLGFVLFQRLVKGPLIWAMPDALRFRLQNVSASHRITGVNSLIGVCASVLIGAATHLVWDSFTHQSRWGVRLLPILDKPIMTLTGQDVQVYKLLQYGSSIIGLPLLLALAVIWLKAQPALPRDTHDPYRGLRWAAFLCLGMGPPIIGAAIAIYSMNMPLDPTEAYRFVGIAARAVVATSVIVAIGFGVIHHIVGRMLA